jgi:hypothetical protein
MASPRICVLFLLGLLLSVHAGWAQGPPVTPAARPAPTPCTCPPPPPSVGGVGISVAATATGGDGSPSAPWTGWDALFSGGGVANTLYYFEAGHYAFRQTLTIDKARVRLVGEGIGITTLHYEGTGDGVVLGTSAVNQYHLGIEQMTMLAEDKTATKHLLTVLNVANSYVRDLALGDGGNSVAGGTGSVALRTRGRETSQFQRLYIQAEKPIVIDTNPAEAGISADHFHFENLYLVSVFPFPLVTIADGAVVLDTTFDGSQAWVGGNCGLYWNDTTGPGPVSLNVVLRNVRWEQNTVAGGWAIWIAKAGRTLQQLIIENLNVGGGLGRNGVHLDQVLHAAIRNMTYASSDAGRVALESLAHPVYVQNLLLAGTPATVNYGPGGGLILP